MENLENLKKNSFLTKFLVLYNKTFVFLISRDLNLIYTQKELDSKNFDIFSNTYQNRQVETFDSILSKNKEFVFSTKDFLACSQNRRRLETIVEKKFLAKKDNSALNAPISVNKEELLLNKFKKLDKRFCFLEKFFNTPRLSFFEKQLEVFFTEYNTALLETVNFLFFRKQLIKNYLLLHDSAQTQLLLLFFLISFDKELGLLLTQLAYYTVGISYILEKRKILQAISTYKLHNNQQN